MSDVELSPCPFCGSADITIERYGHGVLSYFVALCGRCCAESCSANSRDEAVAAWNRRAPPGREPALRAALQRIADRSERIINGEVQTGAVGAADYNVQVARAALAGAPASGPYRVAEPEPESAVAMGEGPSVLDARNNFVCEASGAAVAHLIAFALNEHAARMRESRASRDVGTPPASRDPLPKWQPDVHLSRLTLERAADASRDEAWRTLCVECGPNVAVDEDRCCVQCGATATGTWLLNAEPVEVGRLRAPLDGGTAEPPNSEVGEPQDWTTKDGGLTHTKAYELCVGTVMAILDNANGLNSLNVASAIVTALAGPRHNLVPAEPSRAPREQEAEHGKSCAKAAHMGDGYLHGPDDDEPYDIDGVWYCGRCHEYLPREQRVAAPEGPAEP